jgi:DNA-binding NarL/FixJ family response regulator
MSHARPRQALKVLVVDDTALIRQAVRDLLTPLPTVKVAGEAGDGESGVKMTLALRPDIVIMDVQMPKVNGIDATRRIREALPQTSVIGFSVQTDQATHQAMAEAGAAIILAKEQAAQLPQVIESLIAKAPG